MRSISNLICFKFYSLCININKNVFIIGDTDNDNDSIIKQVTSLSNISMISCSEYFLIFLINDDIYIITDSINYTIDSSFRKFDISNIFQVSCGYDFIISLSYDGLLYSLGYNEYGQLGIGSYNSSSTHQLIPNLNNVEFFESGKYFSICKTYDNEYYSWGNNEYGQLGQGNYDNCNKPIQCLNWPDNIIDIKCGYNHVLLLTSEGQIYSFGNNGNGQLGIDDFNSKIINIPTLINNIPEIQRIECGFDHSMCIDINNNIWLFGSNYLGQLGLGDTEHRFKPIKNKYLENIIDCSHGGFHTFVKTIDNKIYAFGDNQSLQLGIKTKEKHQLIPIQVLENNEDIWCLPTSKSRAKSARK